MALGVERYKEVYNGRGPVTADLFTAGRVFDFSDGLTDLTPTQAPQWAHFYETMRGKWDSARYVGDKMTTIRVHRVWQTLPDARFVRIVRDLEPVAASWEARANDADDLGWDSGAGALAAVQQWNRAIRRVRRAVRQRPDHAVAIEYHRFFGDPQGTAFGLMMDWLGLDRDPDHDAYFALRHREYVERVAPKRRALSPSTQAFLQQHAERDAWEQVTTQLAL